MGTRAAISVLATAATLLFERGKSRILNVLQGEESLKALKLDLIRPSVFLGLLCTALVLWKIRNPINHGWLTSLGVQTSTAYYLGKWIESKVSPFDEPLLPFLDHLIINTLVVLTFSAVSYTIEHVLNCGAHLSWIIYCCLLFAVLYNI